MGELGINIKKTDELFTWLCQGALPNRDGRGIVEDMCNKLVEAGVSIDRFALFIFTIHPTIAGRRIAWSPEEGATMVSAGYDLFNSDVFRNNPIPQVIETKNFATQKAGRSPMPG